MAYSATARTATAAARIAADLPILASGNAARTAVVNAQWRASGSWASGSDIAQRFYPGKRAHDGAADCLTRSAAPAGADDYLIFELSGARPFDLALVVESNFSSLASPVMALEIANANDFVSGAISLCSSWTSGRRRHSNFSLGPITPSLYSNVQWARLRLTTSGWGTLPELAELMLLRGYYLPQVPDVPYDNRQALSADVSVFEADTGAQHRYSRYSGRLELDARWESDDAAFAADLRAFWAGCNYGADPFVWIPNPTSAPSRIYVMRAEETDFALEQIENPGKFLARLRAKELAPFVEGGIL